MSFENYCVRARLNAVIENRAQFVTLINGIYEVTTNPKNLDCICYTAKAPHRHPENENESIHKTLGRNRTKGKVHPA